MLEKKTGRVDPAELTQGRVDSGAELVQGRVDPLPIEHLYFRLVQKSIPTAVPSIGN